MLFIVKYFTIYTTKTKFQSICFIAVNNILLHDA